MSKLLFALLLSATAVPLLAAAPDGPERGFTGLDLFKLEGATDPQISPDGSQVAYVRKSADIMTDKMRPGIWLIDVKTGRHRPVLTGTGAAMSPRWSPDGRRLAYVSAEGESPPQLHVLWLDSGATAKVTGLPQSPSNLAWSPDGKSIAYVMRVPGKAMTLGKGPDKPEGAKWAEPLEIIDRVSYRNDDAGYVQPGYRHIFVVPADGGSPQQLTFGNFDDRGPLSWTPDSRTLLFSANRGPDWEREVMNSEVFALDIASGTLKALTSRNGPDEAPLVSPDGRHIAFLGFDDVNRSYENSELFISNIDGSAPRSLTAKLDRSINEMYWAGNGALIISYDDHGARRIARVGLDGNIRPLIDDLMSGEDFDRPYTGGSFTVSTGGTIAYTGGSALRPADVRVVTGSSARQLTQLNQGWLAAKAMAPVTKLPVKAPDGRTIDAWLVTPPGHQAGQRVPLILEIHGGPNAAYGPSFSTDNQLYAAHGYAVLYVNPRGSTSYGEVFANLIDRAYPGTDYDDLMAAVDAAIAEGTADPDNLFVTGGSGGGVLTSWIVGKTNRFKAAATQKPVINWASEALTMDSTTFTSRYWFDKKPWEDPMSYWNRSPLSLVGNVATPTLVVVGSEDYRTPVSEAEQYYAALQIRGVPTALVKVPGASHHGLAGRPSQSAAKAAAILAWFDRYRAKKEGDGASSAASR